MSADVKSAIYASSEGIGWHGIGHEIPADIAKDPAKLAALLGADWRVESKPVFYQADDGSMRVVDNAAAQVRNDSGEVLSVTSENRYHVTNRQPVDMLEAFRDELAKESLHISHAALLKGGRIVAVSAKLAPDSALYVGDNLADRVEQFLTLSTGYDKLHGTKRVLGSIRVVCSNTLMAAINDGRAAGRLRTIKASSKFSETTLTDLLGGLAGELETQKRTYDALANASISGDNVARYFADVLEINIDDLNRTDRNGKPLVATKSRNMLDALVSAYKSAPGSQISTANGTLWGALNAVTYYATHEKTVRDTDGSGNDAARIASNLFGDAQRLKSRALELATARLAVAA